MFWFRHKLPLVPPAAVLLALALLQIPAVRGQVINRSLETRLAVAEMNTANANRRVEDLEKKVQEYEKAFLSARVEYAELRLKIEYLLWLNGAAGLFIIGNGANFLVDTIKRRMLMSEQRRDTKS